MNKNDLYYDFIDGHIKWADSLGLRPIGFLDEPEKYGEWESRATYLDVCNCGNPDCQAYVSRYADDGSLCKEQTLYLRNEVSVLISLYVELRAKTAELIALRNQAEQWLGNVDENRQSTIDNYSRLMDVIPTAMLEMIHTRDAIQTSGAIEVLWEDGEDGSKIGRLWWIDCPLYELIKPQPLMLDDGIDRAKKLEDEIEAAEIGSFWTDDDLKNLFNLSQDDDINTDED
jgi:hypothetical protein